MLKNESREPFIVSVYTFPSLCFDPSLLFFSMKIVAFVRRTLFVFTAVLFVLRAESAEPPKPRNGDKLVIVNDDGFSKFYGGYYPTEDALRKRLLKYEDTQVAVFEWCFVAGSRVNYPSEIHELIGEDMKEFPRRGDKLAAETLRRLRDEGVDTLAVVADTCHQMGVACYASMRMNGDYPATAWDGQMAPMFNSDFWHQHPEFHQRSEKGDDLTRLSYAFPEVREFKLSFLREAVQRDIDGINFDFQRHPNFVRFEQPMLDAFEEKYGEDGSKVSAHDPRWFPLRAEVMNTFVRDARKILDAAGKVKGKRLGLSARIDWEKYAYWGCDIETWLKEGWIDYLVVGQYGLGGYEFDISPFVKMADDAGTGCAVLFGEECIVSGHDRTPKEDKAIAEGKMKPKRSKLITPEEHHQRAKKAYEAGADGMHLFNLSYPAVLKTIGTVAE